MTGSFRSISKIILSFNEVTMKNVQCKVTDQRGLRLSWQRKTKCASSFGCVLEMSFRFTLNSVYWPIDGAFVIFQCKLTTIDQICGSDGRLAPQILRMARIVVTQV